MHVETHGSGAPLLLIHGWGMHGGMWGEIVQRLAGHFRVLTVDLPGHGWSGKGEVRRGQDPLLPFSLPPSPFSMDVIVEQLADQLAEPLVVCGWSLGGQIALRWALRHPRRIKRLILVASTPCFVRQPDWGNALPPETLAEFAAALHGDYAQTLRRFLALQVRGSERERELLIALRNALLSRGKPDFDALQLGLEILRATDLRHRLAEICQPTLIVAGVRDTLTPFAASKYLAAHIPGARLAAIEGAAHAPFLSHPDEFMEHMMRFLNE